MSAQMFTLINLILNILTSYIPDYHGRTNIERAVLS